MPPSQKEHLPVYEEEISGQPEKRRLATLLGLTAVLLLTFLGFSYLIPYYGFGRIHPQMPWVVGALMASLGGLILIAFVLLIVVTLLGHDVPFSLRLRSVALKFLLPVLIGVGKLVGLRKEQVQHAFVAVNNELVMAQWRNGRPPRNILLLMPHCLQFSDCAIKVTSDVSKCQACGKCKIKDLVELAQKYNVHLSVATGGTLARRRVAEAKPEAIIAVACERDLTSGIQDAYPLPVIGILNDRPFGPCFNTSVDISKVAEALEYFVGGSPPQPIQQAE